MRIAKQFESETGASQLSVSKKLHPEDIVIGDFVAVSVVVYQYASFNWCSVDTTTLPPREPVRLACCPNDGYEPLVVKSVCLPFVLCEKTDGKHFVVDVRLNELVRLDKRFAKLVRKELKANDDSKSNDKSKSKKKKSKRKNRSK